MTKTGIVMSTENNIAYLMTPSGEFTKVKFKGCTPTLGQIYTGECITTKKFSFKHIAMVASICCIFILGGGTYAYYSPVTSLIVNINPSVGLEANIWNKIVKTTALNEDGEKILESISLKNKSIDSSLSMLIEEAKKENFITPNYISEGKKVTITISSKIDKAINLKSFTNVIEENKLTVMVNDDPVENLEGTVYIDENIDSNKNSTIFNHNKKSYKEENEKNKNIVNEVPKGTLQDKNKDKDKNINNKNNLDNDTLDNEKDITNKKEIIKEKDNNKKHTPDNKKSKTNSNLKKTDKNNKKIKKDENYWKEYNKNKEDKNKLDKKEKDNKKDH